MGLAAQLGGCRQGCLLRGGDLLRCWLQRGGASAAACACQQQRRLPAQNEFLAWPPNTWSAVLPRLCPAGARRGSLHVNLQHAVPHGSTPLDQVGRARQPGAHAGEHAACCACSSIQCHATVLRLVVPGDQVGDPMRTPHAVPAGPCGACSWLRCLPISSFTHPSTLPSHLASDRQEHVPTRPDPTASSAIAVAETVQHFITVGGGGPGGGRKPVERASCLVVAKHAQPAG